jgi:hypothetical protein
MVCGGKTTKWEDEHNEMRAGDDRTGIPYCHIDRRNKSEQMPRLMLDPKIDSSLFWNNLEMQPAYYLSLQGLLGLMTVYHLPDEQHESGVEPRYLDRFEAFETQKHQHVMHTRRRENVIDVCVDHGTPRGELGRQLVERVTGARWVGENGRVASWGERQSRQS